MDAAIFVNCSGPENGDICQRFYLVTNSLQGARASPWQTPIGAPAEP